jgi:hypothetical protein
MRKKGELYLDGPREGDGGCGGGGHEGRLGVSGRRRHGESEQPECGCGDGSEQAGA